MEDLTGYGEQELSLHVMNTEHLYHAFMRCDDEQDLKQLVDGEFIYSLDQWAELCDDLELELEDRG
jgi:hypothetical protein